MLQGSTFELDVDKLKHLVHYICHRKRDRPKQLSRTKLHKILFYSDLQAYLSLGRPITGEVYIKHQFGPFSTHLDEVVRSLEENDALVVSEDRYVAGKKERSHHLFFSRKEPVLSSFGPEEISIVEHYIDFLTPYSTQAVSDASHDIVWQTRDIGEQIPYYSGFLYTLGEIRPQDLDWVRQELAEWEEGDED